MCFRGFYVRCVLHSLTHYHPYLSFLIFKYSYFYILFLLRLWFGFLGYVKFSSLTKNNSDGIENTLAVSSKDNKHIDCAGLIIERKTLKDIITRSAEKHEGVYIYVDSVFVSMYYDTNVWSLLSIHNYFSCFCVFVSSIY